jgi:hypothetical protein
MQSEPSSPFVLKHESKHSLVANFKGHQRGSAESKPRAEILTGISRHGGALDWWLIWGQAIY